MEGVDLQELSASRAVNAVSFGDANGDSATDDGSCKHDSATRDPEFVSTPTEYKRGDEFGENDGVVENFEVENNPYQPNIHVERVLLVMLKDMRETRRDKMELVSKDVHDEASLTTEE